MLYGMSCAFQGWHIVLSVEVLTNRAIRIPARRLQRSLYPACARAPMKVRSLTSSPTIKARSSGRLFDNTSISHIPCVHWATFKRLSTMATRDVSDQSNIHKMKTESDGSFKRQASSFRDVIERGGKFEPDPGRWSFESSDDASC